MTNTPGPESAELITLALVIAFSPLSIIPGILMLFTPRARPASLSFLLGWMAGIAGLTFFFKSAYNVLGGFNRTAVWAPYARITLGAALIAFGLYRWLSRSRSPHTSAWMRSVSGIGPGRAAMTGAVLTVINPKVLLTCAAAGLTIGASGSRADVAVFTAVASSSVALPVLAYAIAGKKIDEPLLRLKSWMEAQHAALVAAVLIAIGLLILYRGARGL